jgi:RNA polymerase sigma-70 factor (ECF subfamily)
MSAGTRPNRAFDALAAERSLLARLRAGDESCFEELVRTTSPRLLATLRRMLRSEEDARDALQETFLAAFRALETFEGQAKLSTWLHRIAVNAALMKLRSRRRHPEEPIDDLLPRFDASGHRILEPAERTTAAEDALDEERRRAAVRRCIDRLPETHRSVLVLRDIEGLGTDETARALGISHDAAKMRLHRARQALRTLLVREGVLRPASRAAQPARARRLAAGSDAPDAARPGAGGSGRPRAAAP